MDMIGAVGRLQDSLSKRKAKQSEGEHHPHKKTEPAASQPRQPEAVRTSTDSGTQIGNLVDTSV